MIDQVPVLQQMYVNQGQFIIGRKPEKPPNESLKHDWMHFILPMLVGVLLCGIPLASVLTLYLKSQCCTGQSTTATTISTTVLTTQTPVNQTNSIIVVKQPYYCSGISPSTLWQLYSTDGITMIISTSNCSFNSTPLYFTSLAGTSSHWIATSYTAIYSPTPNSFRVYARSLLDWNNTLTLSYSQTYVWNINWFGISN